jgi:hypothetical protein
MTRKIVKYIYKFHVFSIVLGLGIIALCLIQIPDTDEAITIPYFDKIVHYLMYLFLGGAYLFESSHKEKSGLFWNYAKEMIYCGLMAGAIELAQGYLTDYRSSEWLDFWFGMAGAFTSCVAAISIRLAFRSHGR